MHIQALKSIEPAMTSNFDNIPIGIIIPDKHLILYFITQHTLLSYSASFQLKFQTPVDVKIICSDIFE